MDRKELNIELNLHKMWLNSEFGGRRANLRSADLSGANLNDANLKDADLRRANLSDADLSDADLRSADLRRANLSDADLRSADLSGANLNDANLKDADLRRANLSGADLDYSCLPLWCGGLKFKACEKIAKQLLFHVLSVMQHSNIKIPETKKEIIDYANGFHRAECERLK